MLFCIYLSSLSYIYLSYFELLKYPALIVFFASLDLSIYQFIGKNKKVQHTIKFLSSREHPTVHLCCATPTFMLFHCSFFFLKFVNNFHLKLSLHFKIQYFWCAQIIILPISDIGLSTVILNPVDVFHRWCKLSFRPARPD